jgi:hypothetical protein
MGFEEKVDERVAEVCGSSRRQRDRYCLLRCEDCGYCGDRRFVLRADGEWREILGGDLGITPEMCRCDCGSSRLVCEEVVSGALVSHFGGGAGRR